MAEKLIYKKLNLIMNSAPNISKGRTNNTQGYAFRGIDDFYELFQPLFAEHGITVDSEILSHSRDTVPTKNGGTMNYTTIHMRFKFTAEDESFVVTDSLGEASDSGDKSANKAMSAALKYALTPRFLVTTGEDNDTESQSPEFNAPSSSRANQAAPKTVNNPTGKIITGGKAGAGKASAAPMPTFDTFGSSSFGFKSTEDDVK